MLVLSRKQGDSLVIAGDIHVTVLEIKGDTIRLGIEAPRAVPVHRHEVFARLQAPPATTTNCLALGSH